jgi:hypothetical protein
MTYVPTSSMLIPPIPETLQVQGYWESWSSWMRPNAIACLMPVILLSRLERLILATMFRKLLEMFSQIWPTISEPMVGFRQQACESATAGDELHLTYKAMAIPCLFSTTLSGG